MTGLPKSLGQEKPREDSIKRPPNLDLGLRLGGIYFIRLNLYLSLAG